MDGAAGEEDTAALRVTFDPRLKLEFHGSRVTSDAGLLPFRDLDDALGLTDLAGEVLADTRTGQNSRHTLIAQLRQSVFGRLAGYEDVNDADRLAHDPALRWIVGGRAVTQRAASTSQMGRFETEVLTQEANLSALTDLSGCWIDCVHARRPVKGIVLDLDSSVTRLKHLFWSSIWAGACFWEIHARVALRRGRPRRFGEVCGGAAGSGGGEVARTRAGSGIPADFISTGITPLASVRTVQVLPPLSTVASWSRSRSRRRLAHSAVIPASAQRSNSSFWRRRARREQNTWPRMA